MVFGYLPDDPKEAAAIKKKASQFYYNATSRMLYRCTLDGLLLRYLLDQEARKYSNKPMMVFVELINPIQNSTTEFA